MSGADVDGQVEPPGPGAQFSIDGRYRYSLSRLVGAGPRRACFVMLNPSTADAVADDPTIRKCRGFAERWECGRFDVVNLFALRSTNPAGLAEVLDPVGPHNDAHIRDVAARADLVVAAWGGPRRSMPFVAHRAQKVEAMLVAIVGELWCLGTAKDGDPRHPLMLAYTTPLESFRRRGDVAPPTPTTKET